VANDDSTSGPQGLNLLNRPMRTRRRVVEGEQVTAPPSDRQNDEYEYRIVVVTL